MCVDNLPSGYRISNSTTGRIHTFATAEFEVRKWTSYDTKLVEQLSKHYREPAEKITIKSDHYIFNTLGIKLNAVPDHLSFAYKLNEQSPVTKRQILSEVTRHYVPHGWLLPTRNQLKSFIQLMWMERISWDQTLSTTRYGRLRQQLKELEDIKLPRLVLFPETTRDLQLPVFCDASSCCLYATRKQRSYSTP